MTGDLVAVANESGGLLLLFMLSPRMCLPLTLRGGSSEWENFEVGMGGRLSYVIGAVTGGSVPTTFHIDEQHQGMPARNQTMRSGLGSEPA